MSGPLLASPADAPRVITVGGTDPLAGAGVFADLLALAENGAIGLPVVTALVDQDSHGVRSFLPVDPERVAQTLQTVLDDVEVAGVKLGMLASAQTALAVGGALRRARDAGRLTGTVVIDPVMAGGTVGGASLATGDLPAAIRQIANAHTLLTPNAPELARLLATQPATTFEELSGQARTLASQLGTNVLAKGGHLDEPGRDVLAVGRADGAPDVVTFDALGNWPGDIHGTGCLLASLIAGRLAHGDELHAAIGVARQRFADYVRTRVRRIGKGRPQFVFCR